MIINYLFTFKLNLFHLFFPKSCFPINKQNSTNIKPPQGARKGCQQRDKNSSLTGAASIAWRLLSSRNATLSFSSHRPAAGKPGLVGDMDALQQNKFVLIAMVDGKTGANLAF